MLPSSLHYGKKKIALRPKENNRVALISTHLGMVSLARKNCTYFRLKAKSSSASWKAQDLPQGMLPLRPHDVAV